MAFGVPQLAEKVYSGQSFDISMEFLRPCIFAFAGLGPGWQSC